LPESINEWRQKWQGRKRQHMEKADQWKKRTNKPQR